MQATKACHMPPSPTVACVFALHCVFALRVCVCVYLCVAGSQEQPPPEYIPFREDIFDELFKQYRAEIDGAFNLVACECTNPLLVSLVFPLPPPICCGMPGFLTKSQHAHPPSYTHTHTHTHTYTCTHTPPQLFVLLPLPSACSQGDVPHQDHAARWQAG